MSKVLIFQTAFPGDVVLLLNMIYTVRENDKDSVIDVVVRKGLSDLLKPVEELRNVFELDKTRITSMMGLAKRLKEERYDLGFFPHRSFRSGLTGLMSSIRNRVGFDFGGGRWFHTKRVPHNWGEHETERNRRLLAAAGLKKVSTEFRYTRIDEIRKWGSGVCPGEGHIVIAPGSVWPTKRWIPEKFRELAKELVGETGRKVVVTGTDSDREVCSRVTVGTEAMDISGKTTLREFMGIVSRAALVVANDSAAVHFASALDVPSVCVMGPTSEWFGFAPLHPRSEVSSIDIDCRPCSLHGGKSCPRKHFRCMRDLPVGSVLETCRRVLEQ